MPDDTGLGVVEPFDLEQGRGTAGFIPRARLPDHQSFAPEVVDPGQFLTQVIEVATALLLKDTHEH